MTLENKREELKASIAMYDNTLMDLRLKNKNHWQIDTIEKMRAEVETELEWVETAIRLGTIINDLNSNQKYDSADINYTVPYDDFSNLNNEITTTTDESLYWNELPEVREYFNNDEYWNMLTYEPLRNDMFWIRIGEIPENRVLDFSHTNGRINVTFRESVEFFVEKYLRDNENILQDITITVDYLDVRKQPIYRKTFTGCDLDDVMPCTLSYEDDNLTTTFATFDFKDMKIEKLA